MPSRLDASVVKAVVLSGVGGLRVFFRAVISLTVPGVLELATAALASFSSQNLSVVCSATKLPSACAKVAVTSQKGTGSCARRSSSRCDDQAEGRALHAADREEVGAEAAGGHRDRARQRGAPDQVHVLTRGAGVGQRHRELVELVEGALDLVLGEGGVAGALHRRAVLVDSLGGGEVRVGLDDLQQCLEADQLALAVVVGRDHEVVGVGGDLLQGADHVLVRRLLDQVGVDQVARIRLLPVVVGLGEGGIEDVALEADRHLVDAVLVGPLVVGRLEGGALLGGSAAQDLGDLLRAVVLLGDYQSHSGPPR